MKRLLISGVAGSIAQEYRYWWWSIVIAYLPTVLLLQRVMRNREAFQLKWVSLCWNLTLSFASFVGVLIFLFCQPEGIIQSILEERDYHPLVRVTIALFCLSKIVEFGDTFLLVLRKKPVIFLHLYHHFTVALYAWDAQRCNVSFGHIFAFVNLFIHSYMYFYYALASLMPRRHPLLRLVRPHITSSQILQMFFGMVGSWVALQSGSLQPDVKRNAMWSLLIYTSYAYLFLLFYIQNYVKGVHPGMAVAMGMLHVVALLGIRFLFTHSAWLQIVFEATGLAMVSLSVSRGFSTQQQKKEQPRKTSESECAGMSTKAAAPEEEEDGTTAPQGSTTAPQGSTNDPQGSTNDANDDDDDDQRCSQETKRTGTHLATRRRRRQLLVGRHPVRGLGLTVWDGMSVESCPRCPILLLNPWMVWGIERYKSVVLHSTNKKNLSLFQAIVSDGPVVLTEEKASSGGGLPSQEADRSPVAAMMMMDLSVFLLSLVAHGTYGALLHKSALLGVAVFAALRWCVEIHFHNIPFIE